MEKKQNQGSEKQWKGIYNYVQIKKKLIAARKMGPVCSHTCKLKYENDFSLEQRLAVFNNYWQSGDLNVQRQFIYNNMTKIELKYRYVRVGSTSQNFNHAYFYRKTLNAAEYANYSLWIPLQFRINP